jgi:hypothetical protein
MLSRVADRACHAAAEARDPETPAVTAFECQLCIDSARAEADPATETKTAETGTLVKTCPGAGCGVSIERTGGCKHMHCPIPSCDTHWCWVCGRSEWGPDAQDYAEGTPFDEDSIYDHLVLSCGGIF